MADQKTDDSPKALKLGPRDLIYGVVMVIGFGLIAKGVNEGLGWGLPEVATTVIGAALGVAATFALAWLRKR